MTIAAPQIDPLAKALAPIVREMMMAEVERLAARKVQQAPSAADVEINGACREVARASDRLLTARFSGAAEAAAHRSLVKSTMHLSKVMRKHGRMPKGG